MHVALQARHSLSSQLRSTQLPVDRHRDCWLPKIWQKHWGKAAAGDWQTYSRSDKSIKHTQLFFFIKQSCTLLQIINNNYIVYILYKWRAQQNLTSCNLFSSLSVLQKVRYIVLRHKFFITMLCKLLFTTQIGNKFAVEQTNIWQFKSAHSKTMSEHKNVIQCLISKPKMDTSYDAF